MALYAFVCNGEGYINVAEIYVAAFVVCIYMLYIMALMAQ